MYLDRLKHYQKLLPTSTGEQRFYYNQVIMVIEHLMTCKEAHSWKQVKTGLKMCKELGV